MDGGAGQDTAYYGGLKAEYSISWDPDSGVVTVVDNKTSNGDDGTDSLIGIERIVFQDAEVSLSEAVGNAPPVANASVFGSAVQLQSGMGIEYSLPDDHSYPGWCWWNRGWLCSKRYACECFWWSHDSNG